MKNPYKAKSKVNPQKEDGHREICNPVFQALIEASLSSGELRVALAVIDRSWGFGKESANISLSYFEEATSLSRRGAIDAIKGAEDKHVIVVNRSSTKHTNEYLLNKHIDTWISSEADFTTLVPKVVKQTSPDQVSTLHQTSEVGVPSLQPAKETLKETLKETKKEKGPDKITQDKMTVFEELKKRRGANSYLAAAEAKAIVWMLKQGYSVEQMMAAYDKLKKEPFWKPKFLGMQQVATQIGEVMKIGHGGGHTGKTKSYKEGIGKPLDE